MSSGDQPGPIRNVKGSQRSSGRYLSACKARSGSTGITTSGPGPIRIFDPDLLLKIFSGNLFFLFIFFLRNPDVHIGNPDRKARSGMSIRIDRHGMIDYNYMSDPEARSGVTIGIADRKIPIGKVPGSILVINSDRESGCG